jgi:large subunit ribosomal protein L23
MNSNILKSPIISEKSLGNATKDKFSFIVDRKANKEDVSRVVTDLFDVVVLDVNIANIKGKVKRTKKGEGKRSDYKKAVVTLKKGQKIDLFEIEKEDKKTASKQVSK